MYGLKIEVNRTGRNKISDMIQPANNWKATDNLKTDSFENLVFETHFIRKTSEANHRAKKS